MTVITIIRAGNMFRRLAGLLDVIMTIYTNTRNTAMVKAGDIPGLPGVTGLAVAYGDDMIEGFL